ncbi:tetratricopeptide repeat protein [Paraglaciecola sp. L3A3]|uniref:tetratricopeptide repeat protein n=1 Tax=Paraglaciecola sp. L3A3 TaxID=2686358 RepID=UPI00131DC097|nr:tetratricopeptide repeat protein [Paraglaciecola sp. L3A3]
MNIIAKSLSLSLLISFSSFLLADEKAEFKQSFANFAKYAQSGDFATSLPHAKKVYELSQNLFSKGDANRLNAAENYALTLKQLGKDSTAEEVLLDKLTQEENKFGQHASELQTSLSDLSALSLSKAKMNTYQLRFEKVHLRHNSRKYVKQLLSSKLTTAPLATQIKASLEDNNNTAIKLHETAHWSIITVGKSNKFAKHTKTLLEKIYKSMLSFRIALDIPPAKLQEKLVAVYFENHQQRQKFTTDNRQTNGQYVVLVLAKNNKAFPVANTTRNTVELISNADGLERKVKGRPAWLFNGLYGSFLFASAEKEFGPQTDNYLLQSIVAIKKISAKSSIPSVHEIVSFVGNNSSTKRQNEMKAFYPFFVRYLYEFKPEPLSEFFYSVTSRNAKRTPSAFRSRFTEAFGEIESHETPFQLFLQKIIKVGEQKIAANSKK